MENETDHTLDRSSAVEFDKLVALCQKLRTEKRLHSGLVFFVESGKVTVKPLPPEAPEGHEPLGMTAHVQNSLSVHQQVRHGIARYFDIEARTWNELDIARMLTHIEHHLRKQLYLLEDGGVHNPYIILSLETSLIELGALVMSPKFKKKWWRSSKLAMLNKHARSFFEVNQRRVNLLTMSSAAETILAVDELRKGLEDDSSLAGFILSVTQTGIYDALKTAFRVSDP